jgi:hypothetical protein
MQLTTTRSLEKILLPASLALGIVHAWIGRYSMNPDGVSYLDVGDALVRRDWANAVNAYWSPLYAWILGVVVGEIRPSPKWEFPLVHAVNFAIFVGALLAFRFFLHSILMFCHDQPADVETKGTEALPDWVIVLLGYSLFLWASLELVTLYDVSPDLLVLSCLCLTSGMMLRLRRNPTLWSFAGVGLLFSLGYWAKAVLFPLGFVSLAFIYLWGHSSRSWRRGTAVTALAFVCASAPLITLLSRQKARFTFGESGKLAYAWLVSPQTLWRNWQGNPPGSGTPVHPTRQLLGAPPLFEFDGPVHGTYPPWTDPSYWNEGLRWNFRMTPQVKVIVANFATEISLLLRAQPGLVVAVIVFALLSGAVWLAGLRELWPLVAIPGAAFGVYLPVLVESRYLAGAVVILFLTLFAAVRLRPADQKSAGYVAIAVFITMALGTADLTVRYATHRLAIPGSGPDSAWQDVLAAEQLQKMGARPGDKVAVIGDGTGAYWARLAKLRIVAEVMGANHGSAQFWSSSEEAKERVYAAFAGAGASLVVASCPAHAGNGWRGLLWQPISETDYCVLPLHPAIPG